MAKPGGEFAGAWEALAAASRGKRRTSSRNAFPSYSTDELWRDLRSPSLDGETRAKMEAEIFRRTGVDASSDEYDPAKMFPFSRDPRRTTD